MTEKKTVVKGRKSVLTPDVHERLVDAVRAGAPPTQAAAYVGIAVRTYHDWMQRGQNEAERLAELHAAGEDPPPDEWEQRFLDLWVDVEQAKAQAGVRNIANLQKVATGGFVVEQTERSYVGSDGKEVTETSTRRAAPDWRAAAWWLERMDRANFGKEPPPEERPQTVIIAGVDITALAARVGESLSAAMPAAAPAQDIVDGDVVDQEQPVTPANLQRALDSKTTPGR